MAGATDAGGTQAIQCLAALIVLPIMQVVADADQPVVGRKVAHIGQLVLHVPGVVDGIPAVVRPALAARPTRGLDQAAHDGLSHVILVVQIGLALQFRVGWQQADMAPHVVDEDIAPPVEEADRSQGLQDQALDLGLGTAAGFAGVNALGHAIGRIDLVEQAAAQRHFSLRAREIDDAQHTVHFAGESGLDLLLRGVLDIAQRIAMDTPALPGKQSGQQQHQQQHDGQGADQVDARQGFFVRNQFHSSTPLVQTRPRAVAEVYRQKNRRRTAPVVSAWPPASEDSRPACASDQAAIDCSTALKVALGRITASSLAASGR